MIIFIMGSDESRRESMCDSMREFMTDKYKGSDIVSLSNVGWDELARQRPMLASWPSSKMLIVGLNPVFHDVLNDFSNVEVSEILSHARRVPSSLQRHVVRERLDQMVANLRSIGKRVYMLNSAD